MDQFSAHLDRGWELVQRGDPRGAEVSARRALELDGESPEAFNLLGYVSALQGDFEDAVDNYQQAIALDDCYLEAMLNAAEIMIHPLADFGAAERMCDEAIELAETDDERVDTLLLKFDALLGQEQIVAAKDLCGRFPPGPYDNPAHAFLVGRALYEVGEVQRAIPLIEEATRSNGDSADAFYYLALVLDEQGRAAEATRAFLRSRELDLAAPAMPWSVSTDTLHKATQRAVESLEPDLRQWVALEQLFVAEAPGVEVVIDGVDPRAVLLVDSVAAEVPETDPSVDRQATSATAHLVPGSARVIVYRRNLERMAGALDHIEEEIASALRRELAAHFQTTEPGETGQAESGAPKSGSLAQRDSDSQTSRPP